MTSLECTRATHLALHGGGWLWKAGRRTRESSLPARRLRGPGRVRPLPSHVRRRPVGRRHRLPQQAQVNRKLRAVVRRVQDAPPEDPDALAPHVEEGDDLQPPPLILLGEQAQSRVRKLAHPLAVILRLAPLRKNLPRRRLRQPQELAEEAALREPLA